MGRLLLQPSTTSSFVLGPVRYSVIVRKDTILGKKRNNLEKKASSIIGPT